MPPRRYNPDFYERQRRRQSTWNIPRIISSYDETLDDHLVLPRGLLDTATRLIEEAGSKIESDDRRSTGTAQELAVDLTLSPASRPRCRRCSRTTSGSWSRARLGQDRDGLRGDRRAFHLDAGAG